MTRLSAKPTASIPMACNSWSETIAANRFLANDELEWRAILAPRLAQARKRMSTQGVVLCLPTVLDLSGQRTEWLEPHMAQTEARVRQHQVVLCLQDTTELDFNGQEIAGIGPLSYEAQRGLYVHLTYVVTHEREPLGVTDDWMWAPHAKDDDGNPSNSHARRLPRKNERRRTWGKNPLARLPARQGFCSWRRAYVGA